MGVHIGISLTPWNTSVEPTQGNIIMWLDNLVSKSKPFEDARWNQANIDTLFVAGNQTFINRSLSFTNAMTANSYYFNLVQQPINMITGRQRQHRKSIVYQAVDGADPHTTDQYTKLIMEVAQKESIHEMFSKSCELSAVAGLNLMQPYLDFTGDDPAQGQMKVKIWEYNSFITDPFWRNPDMSDCQYIVCQEYISQIEADLRFGEKMQGISPQMSSPQRFGNFYFLPENQTLNRSGLYILTYAWYKSNKKRKRLYSPKMHQFFDFAGGDGQADEILQYIPDLEEVTLDSPVWKCAVVLNDKLMFHADNPLWDGPECPFVPNFWNYDPHINQPELRSRSLTFAMRSPQFLFNHKVLTNNDIASSTINSGYKRKVGAVANEDNLKKAGQGWDIIINEGYEMTDVEKIIPSAVPESDLALAQQMSDLVFKVSGIDIENWSGQQDGQISSLTLLMKQDANLLPFQKYFDQWDHALKLLGERLLQIALSNWSAEKVQLIINEEPSAHFYSKVFAKYKTIVEEGLLTATQGNLQAQQMMDINTAFGREVFPPSMIIPKMNITGKGEIIPYLQQQEEQAAAMQAEATNIQHAFEETKLKELTSKAALNIASAKERYGRFESDLGLKEERESELSKNKALATKAKMEALEKMVDVTAKLGAVETMMKMGQIDAMGDAEAEEERQATERTRHEAFSSEFVTKIMNGLPTIPGQEPGAEQGAPQEEQPM